jgi:hypothetical protein
VTPYRQRATRATILATLALTATTALMTVSTVEAGADETKGLTAGRVLNNTSETMRAAKISDKGGKPCGPVRNGKGTVLSRTWKCNTRTVKPGNWTPIAQDIDVITFDRSFQVNEHEFKAGEWIKIAGLVLCKNFKQQVSFGWRQTYTLWNTQPRCYGHTPKK